MFSKPADLQKNKARQRYATFVQLKEISKLQAQNKELIDLKMSLLARTLSMFNLTFTLFAVRWIFLDKASFLHDIQSGQISFTDTIKELEQNQNEHLIKRYKKGMRMAILKMPFSMLVDINPNAITDSNITLTEAYDLFMQQVEAVATYSDNLLSCVSFFRDRMSHDEFLILTNMVFLTTTSLFSMTLFKTLLTDAYYFSFNIKEFQRYRDENLLYEEAETLITELKKATDREGFYKYLNEMYPWLCLLACISGYLFQYKSIQEEKLMKPFDLDPTDNHSLGLGGYYMPIYLSLFVSGAIYAGLNCASKFKTNKRLKALEKELKSKKDFLLGTLPAKYLQQAPYIELGKNLKRSSIILNIAYDNLAKDKIWTIVKSIYVRNGITLVRCDNETRSIEIAGDAKIKHLDIKKIRESIENHIRREHHIKHLSKQLDRLFNDIPVGIQRSFENDNEELPVVVYSISVENSEAYYELKKHLTKLYSSFNEVHFYDENKLFIIRGYTANPKNIHSDEMLRIMSKLREILNPTTSQITKTSGKQEIDENEQLISKTNRNTSEKRKDAENSESSKKATVTPLASISNNPKRIVWNGGIYDSSDSSCRIKPLMGQHLPNKFYVLFDLPTSAFGRNKSAFDRFSTMAAVPTLANRRRGAQGFIFVNKIVPDTNGRFFQATIEIKLVGPHGNERVLFDEEKTKDGNVLYHSRAILLHSHKMNKKQ